MDTYMNVEMGNKTVQFLEKEYIIGIFVAMYWKINILEICGAW
jgi:hypothetical protein